MFFTHTKKKKERKEIRVHNGKIEEVDTFIFLGVVSDSLKF